MTAVKDYLDDRHDKLDFYTRAITNAHGQNHPVVFDVRQQYVKLCLDAGNDKNLDNNFAQLLQIVDFINQEEIIRILFHKESL